MRKNLVIAAMADSCFKPFSRKKGGGMNTARLMHSMGKCIYTLLPNPYDKRTEECNQLIEENVAEAIMNLDELKSI